MISTFLLERAGCLLVGFESDAVVRDGVIRVETFLLTCMELAVFYATLVACQ